MEYDVKVHSDFGECTLNSDKITFVSKIDGEASFYIEYDFGSFDDNFLLLPACIYDGNPAKVVKKSYMPMYTRDEIGVDCEEIMTDLPCLGLDKKGSFEVTSGDLSTPCFCLYSKKENECILVFTEQDVKGKNLGFSASNGKVRITYPTLRKERYKLCRPHPASNDTGFVTSKGEVISSKILTYVLPCTSILNLYEHFFNYRKCLLKNERCKNGYTQDLWDLMEKHFNEHNYSGEFYGSFYGLWTPGWTGCGASSLPLYLKGDEETKRRCVQTIDYLTAHQAPSGYYYTPRKYTNEILGDIDEDDEKLKYMHLVRKSADELYFLLKQILYLRGLEVKDEWIISAQKCANAFCHLFNTYGKFGQYVDINTGEMIVGTSCAGTLIPAALALAYFYFGDNDCLEVAEKSAKYYYDNYLKKGYTNGGPGDILCAIDSESGFALLESFVVLYEITKKEIYLDMAKDCAHYCSSWVISYSYKFPKESMFGNLGINTVGAVFANVQNKHGAPGICTLSGDSIYKLWKYTKNDKYLELIKDIASCLPQCVARDDKPFYSWDNPPRKIPAGYINERINTSDWETVGSVFYDSCWCETSVILTFVELMNYPEFKD